MKKLKKHDFQSMYYQNAETGAYQIEVSLEDYSELFNGWDASAVRRKDLEPELLDFLEQAGYEINRKEKLEVCFYLPKEVFNLEKETKSKAAIKNNFKIAIFFIKMKLKKAYRQIITFFLMSLIFITSAYLMRDDASLPILTKIAREGLFIGGWIFVWEAFSLFFFTTHEDRKRRKVFYRYQESEIYFKESKE
jgi:hypothetical protein